MDSIKQQILNRLLQEAAINGHIINAKKGIKNGAQVDFAEKSSTILHGKVNPKTPHLMKITNFQDFNFDSLTPLQTACIGKNHALKKYD